MNEPTPEEIIAAARSGFFEPAANMRQVPMTQDQTRMMLTLMMAPEEKILEGYKELPTASPYEASVLRNVSGRFSRPTYPGVLMFLVFVTHSPADVVMYLSYAHHHAARHNAQQVGFDEFTEAFPNGFWSEEDRLTLWEGQKAPREWRIDNLLDHPAVLDWINSGVKEDAAT